MPWMVCTTCPKPKRFYAVPSAMTNPARCEDCAKVPEAPNTALAPKDQGEGRDT